MLANYYDQALVQYTTYYRTGDARFLAYARDIADKWWRSRHLQAGAYRDWDNSFAPRSVSLGGMILRALDGRPEMWDWITGYQRHMYQTWLGARLAYDHLHYGVRDGGYTLLHAAWLAQTHPDPAVRAEMQAAALAAATQYYVRLQRADGSWRWVDVDDPPKSLPAGEAFENPFHVGVLLEGMIATHRVTGDARILAAITTSCGHLYRDAYRKDELVSELSDGTRWRGMWTYLGETTGGVGTTTLRGGTDTSSIREVREISAPCVHAWGYAYAQTGDITYRDQGDEVAAATWGKGQGPLTDRFYCLMDVDTEKDFSQTYRAGGHYLAWRLG